MKYAVTTGGLITPPRDHDEFCVRRICIERKRIQFLDTLLLYYIIL